MAKRLLIAMLFLASVVAAAAEESEPPLSLDDTASQHFDLGVKYFRARQWDAARAEFQVSFELSKRPDLLHNLSMTAELQGRVAEAIEFERRFLDTAKLDDSERAEAAKRISQLQGKLEGPARPRPSKASLAVGGVGLALGASMLIASIGTGSYALGLKNDLESRPITRAELDQGTALGRTLQSATIALAVVGGAVTVGSITILSLARRRAREQLH